MKLSSLLVSVSLFIGANWGAEIIAEELDRAKTSCEFFEKALRNEINQFQNAVAGDIFKDALLSLSDSPEAVYTKTQLLENARRCVIDIERLLTMHIMTQQRVAVLKAVQETFTDGSSAPTEGRSDNDADSDIE